MKLDAAQRRAILADPAGWIASGFGSGLSPYAPGTAGSLAALIPWFALRELPLPAYALAIVAAFALGVWASNRVVARLHIEDPGVIVWDEFVGQWIALAPLLVWPSNWPWVVVAFALFRLFDVTKPWPVSWADRAVKGGVGVMLDDALAGVYAALVLSAALYAIA
ncbi:phosphatidylglycerophosphatase A [Dokdonella sp.]|uniref:phosphatidylglycerophosphatase A family protein n=1 Tax=Dokdonella sp. TaxID=2291710 RepID=UPI001B0A814B|nr:phosphatidylglycerophosphatase A [Dokdonella sp.]MBO9665085.1 phosphatidylglycerophosphatase A [Dokdonella sp.]